MIKAYDEKYVDLLHIEKKCYYMIGLWQMIEN